MIVFNDLSLPEDDIIGFLFLYLYKLAKKPETSYDRPTMQSNSNLSPYS